MHWMTPKWHWTLQGHGYPIHALLVPMSPKFHSVSLCDQPFLRYRPFWTKMCMNEPDSKMTLNPTRFNIPLMCVISNHEFQIVLYFGLRPAVCEIQAILRQGQCMTKMTLNPTRSNVQYKYSQYPRVSNCTTFRSATSKFWDTCHLSQLHWMTPTLPLTLQGQRYLILVLLMSQSRHFLLRHTVLVRSLLYRRESVSVIIMMPCCIDAVRYEVV